MSEHANESVTKWFNENFNEEERFMYRKFLMEYEKPFLQAVLDKFNGNQSKTAESIGINRATLRSKMLHHGITV